MLWFWILVILWWESFERWLVVPHDVKEIGIHLITYEIWCKFILLSIRTTKIKLVGFWIIESLNSCIIRGEMDWNNKMHVYLSITIDD